MGFNMVFILVNKQDVVLSEIERGLKQIDPLYRFDNSHFMYDDELYGLVDINRPGDGLFEDTIKSDIQYVKERKSTPNAKNAKKVLGLLKKASAVFFVQVLWQGRSVEETIEKYDPLWKWFFANHEGLLYVDFEGFWDKEGLLLSC